MAGVIGPIIADSLSLGLGYAERMLKGVTAETFGRFASPGGVVVTSNHAAFCYGHLSLYAPRILEQLGRPDASLALPAGFEQAFSKDATCVDDPEGTIYPAMEEVTEFFFRGYRAALEGLRSAPDEVFLQQNPMEGRMRELFPTLGSMQGFYVGGHLMMHLGQVSAWRRMFGLPAA
ncbi:MAG: hypothetical protein R3C01_06940 [Planctomycetaceae bacterium]